MNRLNCSNFLFFDPVFCRQMGAAGRAAVERDLSGGVCVLRILSAMKQAVDAV